MDDGDVKTPLGGGGAALVFDIRVTHLTLNDDDHNDDDDH